MKQSAPDSTQLDPLELKIMNTGTNRTVLNPGLLAMPSCSLPNVNLLAAPASTVPTRPLSNLAQAYAGPLASNMSLPNLAPYDPTWASSFLTALSQNPSATASLLNLISATALNPPFQIEHPKMRTNSCFALGRQSMNLVQGHEDDQPLDLTLKNRNRSLSPKLHLVRDSPQDSMTGRHRTTTGHQAGVRSRRSVASRSRTSKSKLTNQNQSTDSVVNEPDSTYHSTNETDSEKLSHSNSDKQISITDTDPKTESVRSSTKRELNRLSDSFSNDELLSATNRSDRTQQSKSNNAATSNEMTSDSKDDSQVPGHLSSDSRRRKTTASRRPFKVFNRPTLVTEPGKLLVETAALIDPNLLTSLVDFGKDSNCGDTSNKDVDFNKCLDLPALVTKQLASQNSQRPLRGRRSQSVTDGRKQLKGRGNQVAEDSNPTNDDSESSNLLDNLSTKSMDSLPLKSPLTFDVKLDVSTAGLPGPSTQLTEPSTDCNPRMRRFPEMTPKEIKDEAYWEKRFKNNEAARRSRRARKSKELCLREYADRLEQINTKLVKEIELLKAEVDRLKAEKNLSTA